MALTSEEFINLLEAMPGRIRQMNNAPAIESAVDEVFASVDKNFFRQTDEDGNLWPPRKDNLPHPLLILTTTMKEAASGGLGSLVKYGRSSVEMGVRGDYVPYAWRHQNGDEGMPRRQYFYLHEEERPRVLLAFGDNQKIQFRKQVIGRK
jgi:hypothetical protein